MSLKTTLEKLKGRCQLLPGLDEAGLARVVRKLGCPMPFELEEALRFSSGIKGLSGPIAEVNLAGGISDLEGLAPHGISIAEDGSGNFYYLEVLTNPTGLGAVYFVSHDPPFVVLQSLSAEEFLQDLRGGTLWTEPVRSRPGHTWEFAQEQDEAFKSFSSTFRSDWIFIDFRDARPGDGFNWARFGPYTRLRRAGRSAIFAMAAPERTVLQLVEWLKSWIPKPRKS